MRTTIVLSGVIIVILFISCSNEIKDKLINHGDCWVLVSYDSLNYKSGTYSSGEIFTPSRGYYVNFGFEDSSISFSSPMLRDEFPKDIESCSFGWKIKHDSLICTTIYGLSYSYKIRRVTRDTLILAGRKSDFIHVKIPIKDTTFYPNFK